MVSYENCFGDQQLNKYVTFLCHSLVLLVLLLLFFEPRRHEGSKFH